MFISIKLFRVLVLRLVRCSVLITFSVENILSTLLLVKGRLKSNNLLRESTLGHILASGT